MERLTAMDLMAIWPEERGWSDDLGALAPLRGEQRRAQAMFHRLAEPKVGGQGQRADELRQADAPRSLRRAHEPSLSTRPRGADGRELVTPEQVARFIGGEARDPLPHPPAVPDPVFGAFYGGRDP